MTAPTLALLSVDGRISASQYRRSQRRIGYILLGLLVLCTLGAAWMLQRDMGGWTALAFAPLLIGLSVSTPTLQIRRLHDFGLSARWLLPLDLGPYVIVFGASWAIDRQGPLPLTLMTAAPFVILIALLIWANLTLQYAKGERTENRFGPPPFG